MNPEQPNFDEALQAFMKAGEAVFKQPPWVEVLEKKIEGTLIAKFGLENVQAGDFEALGKILCLLDLNTGNDIQIPEGNKNDKLQELIRTALEYQKKMLEEMRPAVEGLERAALAQEPDKKQAVIQGYASAIEKARTDSKGIPNWNTQATPIYLAMYVSWPLINIMTSVTQLHDFLRKSFPGQVVERKRIEGICKEIGLKFRGRGAPRKNKS